MRVEDLRLHHEPCDPVCHGRRQVSASEVADALRAEGYLVIGRVEHAFLPVLGHPDDDECTYRSDGTDDTYCGLPLSAHDSDHTRDQMAHAVMVYSWTTDAMRDMRSPIEAYELVDAALDALGESSKGVE